MDRTASAGNCCYCRLKHEMMHRTPAWRSPRENTGSDKRIHLNAMTDDARQHADPRPNTRGDIRPTFIPVISVPPWSFCCRFSASSSRRVVALNDLRGVPVLLSSRQRGKTCSLRLSVHGVSRNALASRRSRHALTPVRRCDCGTACPALIAALESAAIAL